MKIYEYVLPFDSFVLSLRIVELLHVGLDEEGSPTLWFMVNESGPFNAHAFAVLTTNDEVPEDMCYFGSFVVDGKTKHLFYKPESPPEPTAPEHVDNHPIGTLFGCPACDFALNRSREFVMENFGSSVNDFESIPDLFGSNRSIL